MPINVPAASLQMTASLSSFGHRGQAAPALAQAVVTALITFVQASTVQTSDTGAIGGGVGFIPVVIAAPQLLMSSTLTALLQSQFIANGVKGVWAPSLAAAIANGFTQHMALGVVTSQHPGVGSGVAVGTFITPPASSLAQQLVGTMSGMGLVGQAVSRLAQAISWSVWNFLTSVAFSIPILGPAGPAPAVSVGIGRVV